MTLRLRIALGFAAVALATAAVVALATPRIVSQGLAQLESDLEATPSPAAIATQVASARSPVTQPDETAEPADSTDSGESSAGPGGSTEPGEGETEGATQRPAAASALPRSPAPSPSSGPSPASSEIAFVTSPTAAPSAAPAANEAERSGESEGREATDTPVIDPRTQVEQDTTLRLVLVALFAAVAASIAGLLAAGRLARPLSALQQAAEAVAGGDLSRRSGLAGRRDEFGQLGESFDTMAAELQRADENRRRFLQDAAHELRTPLAVIEATSSAILDGVYEPERRHLETIREQSRALSRIVDDLRTISLAEVGRLPLERESVPVAAALESVARAFEVRAADLGAKIEIEAPGGLAVDADPDRLRQMVAALVDNALRHAPRGLVRLVARPAGAGFARLAVEDSGSGFAEDVLPRAFDRFYQGDPAPGREVGTSGLGLSIVRALAEAHGGHAGAENRPEGGARVWFELPVA